MEQIVDRHDQAVISGEAHLLREGGAFYEPTPALADRDRRASSAGGPIVATPATPSSRYVVRHGTTLPRHLGGFTSARHPNGIQFLRPDIHRSRW